MRRADQTSRQSGPKPSALDEIQAHVGEASRLLRALANPRRLQILCALIDGELSVSELNARVLLSQSALSQHLALLRVQQLLKTRRAGQTVYYTLPDGAALRILHVLHEIYCEPRFVTARRGDAGLVPADSFIPLQSTEVNDDRSQT